MALRDTGGMGGILSRALLESAVNRPRAGWGNYACFPTIYRKAAALAEALIHDHPFVDGNKRTALLAAEALLYLNARYFDATSAERIDMVLSVAKHTRSLLEFASWLEENSFSLVPEDAAEA